MLFMVHTPVAIVMFRFPFLLTVLPIATHVSVDCDDYLGVYPTTTETTELYEQSVQLSIFLNSTILFGEARSNARARLHKHEPS